QDVVSDLLGRINSLRASLGLPAYQLNSTLSVAARNQAQWMAETGSISHYRPDGTGPRDRALAAGYPTNWVSENIYMGSDATPNSAWQFWLNSSIHYAGLTSTYYSDIGIGSYSANGSHAFVLVFGNPSGSLPARSPSNTNTTSSSSNGNGDTQAQPAAPPPSFVVGIDEWGNIKHQIQPGDTVGHIAILYGYGWDDIPMLLELNGITEDDLLEIGEIFLIPPADGTYTPTPEPPTATPSPRPPTATFTPTPTMTLPPPSIFVATEPVATVTATPAIRVSILPTATIAPDAAPLPSATSTGGLPPLLVVVILVQVGVLVVATVEYVRRR
ncbi:MAG: hypothetical protein D6712_02345, partial [Chloroflexi bacterium]